MYQTKGPAVIAYFTVCEDEVEHVELHLNQEEKLAWTIDGGSEKIRKAICAWMEAYGKKKAVPVSFPIHFGEMTAFTYGVLERIKQLPFGKSLSYKEVAERVKKPKAARAVGSACRRNPLPLIIPCHRVLSSGGGLGGFQIDIEIKKRLLAFEGII